jgi:flagellar protein FliO/FliZ
MPSNGPLHPIAMPSVGSFVLWFSLIVAAIPLTLWLLKRTPMGGLSGVQTTRVISSTALGPAQRLVTVEVGQGESRQWLVLGVTAQSIQTVHTLPAQDLPAAPALATPPAFAALFNKARKGQS